MTHREYERERLLAVDQENGLQQQQQQTQKNSNDKSNNTKLSGFSLFLLILAFIVMSIVATVGRKLVLDSFGQHLAFFRQVLGVFMYDILVSIAVVFKLLRTNEIPAEIRRANPLYLFAGIGFLDGFSDFLSSVGGVHSPGSAQTILSQLVIPFTIIFAYFLTKQKYIWIQILGATVIVGGIVVATIPDFKKEADHEKPRSSSPSPSTSNSAEGEKTYWYAVIVFAASTIPQAASIVCKDFLFKRNKGKLDVFYLSCLVSWTQLFLIWLFVPLQSFHALGGVPLDQIGGVMEDGARCFIGQDVPKNRPSINWTSMNLGLTNQSSIERCRDDDYLPLMTLAYSVSGFLQGILQLMIVKYHSASLAILCNAITLPLSNLAYSVPVFVGGKSDAEPFSIFDLFGLLITVIGLLIYQWKAVKSTLCGNNDDDDDDDDQENEDYDITKNIYDSTADLGLDNNDDGQRNADEE